MNLFLFVMFLLGCEDVQQSTNQSLSEDVQVEQTDLVVESQEETAVVQTKRVVAQLNPQVFDQVDSVVNALIQQPTSEAQVYAMGMMELGLGEPALFARWPNVSTYVMKHFNVPSATPLKEVAEHMLWLQQPSLNGSYLLFHSDGLLGVVEAESNTPVALYVGSSAIHWSRFSNDSRMVLVAEQDRIAAIPIRSSSTTEEDASPIIFEKQDASLVKELMLLSDEKRMVVHTKDGQVTLLNQDLNIEPVVLATDVKAMNPYPNKDWMLLIKETDAGKHLEMFDANTQRSVAEFDVEGTYIGLMRPPHLVYVVNDKSISIVDTSTQSKALEVQVDHTVTKVVAHAKDPMLLIQTQKAYVLLDLQQEKFVQLPKYVIDAHFDTRGNIHYTSVKAKNSRGREYLKESIGELVQASWFDYRLRRKLYDVAFREPYEDWNYQTYEQYWVDDRILNVYQGVYNTSTREKEERRISDTDDLQMVHRGIVTSYNYSYNYRDRMIRGKILGQDTDLISLRGSIQLKNYNYDAFVVFSSVYTDEAKLEHLEYVQRHTGLHQKIDGISSELDTRLMPDGELLYFHEGICGWFDLQMENHSVECTYLVPLNRELFVYFNRPTVQIMNVKSNEIIAKWEVSSFPNQWDVDEKGQSIAMRSEDTFVIYPDIHDPTKSVTCTTETQTEECTLGAWLDLGLSFSMLSPPKYKSDYAAANVPVFSVAAQNVRAQDIVGIYLNKGVSTDLYARTLTYQNADVDDDFYRTQHLYSFDRTGRWMRYSTGEGFVEYHVPTGRRILGVNGEYPVFSKGRFQTVEEWLLTSLRSSQKRICPNSYFVVELDISDIDYAALSAFVPEHLLEEYCQYP